MTCDIELKNLKTYVKKLKLKYKKQLQAIKKKMATKLLQIRTQQNKNKKNKILKKNLIKINNLKNSIKEKQKKNENERKEKIKIEEFNKKIINKQKEFNRKIRNTQNNFDLEKRKQKLEADYYIKQVNIKHKYNLDKNKNKNIKCDSMSLVFNEIKLELRNSKNYESSFKIIKTILPKHGLTHNKNSAINSNKYKGIILLSKYDDQPPLYITPIHDLKNNIHQFCMYSSSSVNRISKLKMTSLSSQFQRIYVYSK